MSKLLVAVSGGSGGQSSLAVEFGRVVCSVADCH